MTRFGSGSARGTPVARCRTITPLGGAPSLLPRLPNLLFRRLPLLRQPLRFGDLVGGHLRRQLIERFRGRVVAMSSRQTEPHVPENVVARQACALLVHPLCGFGEILRYTLAHLVHGPEEHLRVRAAMLGERPKKLQSRRVVTSVVSRLPVLHGSRAMFCARVDLPTPLGPTTTILAASLRKSSAISASMAARSQRLGQFQSKSHNGLKRPI